MEQSKLLDYYRDSSCSQQWRRFLQAFAEEIADDFKVSTATVYRVLQKMKLSRA